MSSNVKEFEKKVSHGFAMNYINLTRDLFNGLASYPHLAIETGHLIELAESFKSDLEEEM